MDRKPTIRKHPRDDSPYDLGHALAAVGPGWWPLLHDAYAEVAEVPGGQVWQVRQKYGWLDISVRFGTDSWQQSHDFRDRYLHRSMRVCEACGGHAVPVQEQVPRPTRTHCKPCRVRWSDLVRDVGWDAERCLWMEQAGVWLPEWNLGWLDDG